MIRFLFLFSVLLLFFISCKEDDFSSHEHRNFRPINFEVEIEGYDALFTWTNVSNADAYSLQISSDSLFIDVVLDTTVKNAECRVRGLHSGLYYSRVRSVNDDEKYNSLWCLLSFKIESVNCYEGATVGTDTVQIYWNTEFFPSEIVLNSEFDEIKVQISEEQSAEGCAVVKGLRSNYRYDVRILSGQTLVGTGYFVTKTEVDTLQLRVDPSVDIEKLVGECSDGSVIVFEPGTYPLGNKNIVIDGKSVVFQASENSDSDNAAEIYPRSFLLKGKIGTLNFKNLSLSGFAFGGTSYDDLNSYFIDMSVDFVGIDSLIIEGCTIHHLENCIIRGNRADEGIQYASYISFRNCLIYNVNREGKNSYENFKVDKLMIQEFDFQNCTVYDAGHGFFSNRKSSALKKFTLKNCTFDNFGCTDAVPNKYFVCVPDADDCDYTVENCIFSNTKCMSLSSDNHLKGFQVAGKHASLRNSLFFNFPLSASTFAKWDEMQDVLEGVDPKYDDRAIGDFDIRNPEITSAGSDGGGIGDLRWIK